MPDIFIDKPSAQEPDKATRPLPTNEKPKEAKTATQPIPKRMPFFASLCQNPDGVRFANQEENEYVVLFLRKHFSTNLRWLIPTLLLALLPLLLQFLQITFALVVLPIPSNYLTLLLLLYYLGVLGYAFFHFVIWFYNVGIVTNEQVIDIDYTNLTTKDVSAADYESVQETRYNQSGFLASFFDFGDVYVQTDTPHENIEFLTIPKPDFVSNTIQSLKEAALHG